MLKLKEFYQYKREVFKYSKCLKKNLSPKFLKNTHKFFKTNLGKNTKFFTNASQGILYLKSSSNNTIVSLTDLQGKILFSKSCGSLGFQGKKKRSTKFAIQTTIYSIISKIRNYGWKTLILNLNGFGKGRFIILKSLKNTGLRLSLLRDVTPLAHNGCRQRKIRRG